MGGLGLLLLFIYHCGGECRSQEMARAPWEGEFISIHLQLTDASPRGSLLLIPLWLQLFAFQSRKFKAAL